MSEAPVPSLLLEIPGLQSCVHPLQLDALDALIRGACPDTSGGLPDFIRCGGATAEPAGGDEPTVSPHGGDDRDQLAACAAVAAHACQQVRDLLVALQQVQPSLACHEAIADLPALYRARVQVFNAVNSLMKQLKNALAPGDCLYGAQQARLERVLQALDAVPGLTPLHLAGLLQALAGTCAALRSALAVNAPAAGRRK